MKTLAELLGASERDSYFMLKAYFDESGIGNEEFCVMAGYCANAETWDKFNKVWNNILADYDIKVFHGIEFWDRQGGEMKSPYVGWSADKAGSFLEALVGAIQNSNIQAVQIAIWNDLFYALTEDERRWLTTNVVYGRDWPMQGAPNEVYFWAFQHCVIEAGTMTPEGDKVYLTMARQESFAPKALEIYNQLLSLPLKCRDRLGESIVFSCMKEYPGLQAADLLSNRVQFCAAHGVPSFPNKNNELIKEFLKDGTKVLTFEILDKLLAACPFRSSFWEGLTRPDAMEMLRLNGEEVVCYKNKQPPTYLTHHIRRNKVTPVAKFVKSRASDGSEHYALSNQPGINPPDYRRAQSDNSRRSEASAQNLQEGQHCDQLKET